MLSEANREPSVARHLRHLRVRLSGWEDLVDNLEEGFARYGMLEAKLIAKPHPSTYARAPHNSLYRHPNRGRVRETTDPLYEQAQRAEWERTRGYRLIRSEAFEHIYGDRIKARFRTIDRFFGLTPPQRAWMVEFRSRDELEHYVRKELKTNQQYRWTDLHEMLISKAQQSQSFTRTLPQ